MNEGILSEGLLSSLVEKMTEPEIEPATFYSQVLYATDCVKRTRLLAILKMVLDQSHHIETCRPADKPVVACYAYQNIRENSSQPFLIAS